MKQLKKWLLKLWFFFFPKAAIRQVNQKLQEAVAEKNQEKVKLLYEIKDYVKNTLKITKESKHIPLSVRHQACKKINSIFGKRMREHRIKININLELVKV